jgi:hypothetical protein
MNAAKIAEVAFSILSAVSDGVEGSRQRSWKGGHDACARWNMTMIKGIGWRIDRSSFPV